MKTDIYRLGAMALMCVFTALFLAACSPGEEQSLKEKPVTVNPEKEVRDDEAQLLAEGKKAWRSCGMCHCAADPRIKEDEDWVLLNEETT